MRVLVLEDVKSTRVLVQRRLEKMGHEVDTAGNGQ